MNRLSSLFGSVGRKSHGVAVEASRLSDLVRASFYWAVVAPFTGKRHLRKHLIIHQLHFMGNESFLITAMVTAAVGAVLALQAAYQLKTLGAVIYTGSLVNVSMARELGPVVTAIVMAGRVGASVTAELGTMKVQEEVDALTTIGIPPIPYLVVPRVLAMMIALPCLTVLGDAMGMLGGLFIGVFGLDIPGELYWRVGFNALVYKDITSGIVKSVVFAMLIGINATYQGLNVEGGSESVGKATTQSVVFSIIAIILADCLLTAIFFYVLT
jgi:phospholipid/cholesterol/gamma-HCH transport system permease protein